MIYINREKFFSESIFKTVSCLLSGKIVIIPTDTVYGFSGIVSESCEQKIRSIKGREESKPFIQLIEKPEDITLYTDDCIPTELLNLWPGPLTIIVHKKGCECETIAFRCPGDEWLREVIKNCNSPIYSTSVNRSGQPLLKTPKDIIQEFEKEVDLFVAGEITKNATPSTIVAIQQGGGYSVVRQGSIALSTLH